MVNQTLVSFKIDSRQLAELDRICNSLGVKRNKLLNFFVVYGNTILKDTEKLRMMSVYERCMYFEFMNKK